MLVDVKLAVLGEGWGNLHGVVNEGVGARKRVDDVAGFDHGGGWGKFTLRVPRRGKGEKKAGRGMPRDGTGLLYR
jgi:hypothetical protein